MSTSTLRALILACVTAASALPALADGPVLRGTSTTDPYAYTPPPEQLFYNWSGVFVGGHFGSTWSNNRSVLTTVAGEFLSNSGNAFVGGVHGGYQHQFRELVIGAEVSYNWAVTDSPFTSAATPGLTVTTRVSDLMTVTGRLGYAYMNGLAYFKGGWATANVDFTATGAATGTASSRSNGWVGGAGLAYAFGPNVIAGVEYEYIRMNADGATVVPPTTTMSGTGIDLQSVMLRLDFKFGH